MSFKYLATFNVAMLLKQGWKLQTNSYILVSRNFKAPYYPNNSYLESKLGHNPSFVWHNILSVKVVGGDLFREFSLQLYYKFIPRTI